MDERLGPREREGSGLKITHQTVFILCIRQTPSWDMLVDPCEAVMASQGISDLLEKGSVVVGGW